MPVPATYPIFPLMPEWENAFPSDRSSGDHIADNSDTWVKLLHRPNEYSYDEAKLLCQESPDTWVAWIPDYGEIILHRSSFY